MRSLLPLTLLAFALPAQAQPAGIERQVQQFFEQRCAECHGRDLPATKRKGNKQMFLDAKSTLTELNSSKALILGNPADSSIIQKVTEPSEDDRMPPKGARLTAAEITLLRQWIDRNTLATVDGPPPPTAIKRAELYRAVLADLQAAPAASRGWFRYLTLHNLRNAGDTSASLRVDRVAVSKTLNSLSSAPAIAVPHAFGPEQTLLRFDLRAYGWGAPQWEMLVAAYPYDVEPAALTKTERETRQATGTALPLLRADWFVFAATESPFYQELLSLPARPGAGLPVRDTWLEEQLGVEVLPNIQHGRAQRAAFTDSGVSDFNRMIERHDLPAGGYYWKSYDFGNERGEGDLIRNPLGPPATLHPRSFSHDGGESIWSLPNGLQGYLLVTAKGDVITRGPTSIVKDPDGPQGAVINGVSCIRCHAAGMRQPKAGEPGITSTHARARGALDTADQPVFDRLYRAAPAITRQLNADADRFKTAARLAGVTDEAWFTPADEPISRLYLRFRADITGRTLASELDLDPSDIAARLRDYEDAGNADVNSLLQRLPRGIKRQNFIADFSLLSRVFNLGQPRAFQPVHLEEFRETTRPEELFARNPPPRPSPAPPAASLPKSAPPGAKPPPERTAVEAKADELQGVVRQIAQLEKQIELNTAGTTALADYGRLQQARTRIETELPVLRREAEARAAALKAADEAEALAHRKKTEAERKAAFETDWASFQLLRQQTQQANPVLVRRAWESLTKKWEVASAGEVPKVLFYHEGKVGVVELPSATKDKPWVNSLGMKLVPVPGAEVWFSVWHTRVQDFQAFATATGRSWEKPPFAQGPTHPAVEVSWEDAQAFCAWLTAKERGTGLLTAGQSYRLPADWEWSVAVGLNEPRAGSPQAKDGKIKAVYPWGNQWPPPRGAGNYAKSLNVDDYEYTSPVGSFTANAFGLHDMGGNVWQWCDDSYSGGTARVLRGASFDYFGSVFLLSSSRDYGGPGLRVSSCGFRVVLVGGSAR